MVDAPSVINVRRLDSGAMPLTEAMMACGLQVDLDHFAALEKEFAMEMERITAEVHKSTGHYVNLDSPEQVSGLLFKKLGLKQARVKLTDSGSRESADAEVLDAIKHDHPIIPTIIDYRELSKLRGTYVRPMPKLARKAPDGTWRMYPNLTTTRVPSGRYSCKDPNLLAIPTRSKRGKRIRQGFITRPGWKIVACDESQIEVRVTAHRSNCKGLIQVYENDEDVYSDFATTAFKLEDKRYKSESGEWKYPTVDKELHRFPAKTCILASIYRVTASGLLSQMPTGMGWTENKCQDLLNSFYLKYPEVLQAGRIDDDRARRHGMVWDMWGRFMHTPGIKSALPWVVSEALRGLGNMPTQSGACGTLKITMASIHDIWEKGGLQEVVHPLLPIHDELLFECRADVAEEWIQIVGREFENCCRLLVPVKWSGASADNWGNIQK